MPDVTTRLLVAIALIALPLLAETWWSRRNERRLRARGAIEAAGDPYPAMAIVYPGGFAAMILEGLWRAVPVDGWFIAGVVLWALSKALKYAAISSLGSFWSFRVLVLPGARLVTSGPYRWLRHPNYVAVVGELVAAAGLCAAPVAGGLSAAVFALLLRRRILVEERALGLRAS
jgi:methyltransferase